MKSILSLLASLLMSLTFAIEVRSEIPTDEIHDDEVILKKGQLSPNYGVLVPEYVYRAKEAEIAELNLCRNELDLSYNMKKNCGSDGHLGSYLIGGTIGLALSVFIFALNKK